MTTTNLHSHWEYIRAKQLRDIMTDKLLWVGLSENDSKELKELNERLTAFELYGVPKIALLNI